MEFGFAQAAPEAEAETSFVVDVEGFEGPLDLLLDLARRQKVDLHKISVLALAEQYLDFVEAARSLRLELAADYLVMAAWLAYLKSRLLLPQEKKDGEPAAEELAEALQIRLRHLEAIRAAADMLVNRPRIGRDIFLRGQPEPVNASGAALWRVSLFDLLSAYSQRRQKHALERVVMKQRFVWSLARARDELEKFTGYALDWLDLDSFIADYGATPELRRSIRASTLSASLEMVREGAIAIRQDGPFAPLWIKRNGRTDEESAPDNDFGKETSLGGPRQIIS
ncbi:segregation and condensation protein A [Methylocapsa palsarum]|uniref:Segregation and condensation protein A n=1 Tax=Methylocapsa palsarum TaxID=1612308 RepID=A0A1I3Y739_9HYPH|nr:ScpA family protein [Methylocapsa palsarum]SFK27797.1 condensin subunit ScpA [Methylocapsa palsarum]